MWEGTLETHPDPNTEPCWSLPPKLEIGMVVSYISVLNPSQSASVFIGFPHQTISTASTFLLLIELVVLMLLLPLVTRSASATHCI